jgi:hypothetical protein
MRICFNQKMEGEKGQQNRMWYTRRKGVVRGPFPFELIKSFVLLGRVSDTDELSSDKERWHRLSELPDLVPEVMRSVVTDEDRERLLQARMHEDERKAGNRRQRQPGGPGPSPTDLLREPRGKERRSPESPHMQVHRRVRSRINTMMDEKKTRPRRVMPGVGLMLLVVLLGLFFVMNRNPPARISDPDCVAPAAPGVNWSYCHKEGAQIGRVDLSHANLSSANLVRIDLQGSRLGMVDMRYANLAAANLRHADLRSADLKGAVMTNALLTGADLSDADLSFANLTGADLGNVVLKNTNLSRTRWTDGRECAAGSVGVCR